jgi:hypothetical protein
MALLGEVFGRPTLGCDFLSARQAFTTSLASPLIYRWLSPRSIQYGYRQEGTRCQILPSSKNILTLPTEREGAFGQVLPSRQREGLPCSCRLQAGPAEQEIWFPPAVKMSYRFVCRARFVDAGRRRDHAYQEFDRWCGSRPDQADSQDHLIPRRYYHR